MKMIITLRRYTLSILAGVLISVLISFFLKTICWEPFISVFVAVYLAKVATPKEGALIGAIVFLPVGIVFALLQPADLAAGIAETFANFLVLFLTILIVSGVGAVYGLILGTLLKFTKKNRIMF